MVCFIYILFIYICYATSHTYKIHNIYKDTPPYIVYRSRITHKGVTKKTKKTGDKMRTTTYGKATIPQRIRYWLHNHKKTGYIVVNKKIALSKVDRSMEEM